MNAAAAELRHRERQPLRGEGPADRTTIGVSPTLSTTPSRPQPATTTTAPPNATTTATTTRRHDDDDDCTGTTTTTTSSTTTPSRPPASAPAAPPSVSTLPSVHGTPVVGSLLVAAPGRGRRRPRRAYSWLRCQPTGAACVPIANATSSTYKLTPDDRGSRIRVTVIAQNANGSTSATSAATAIVRAHGRPH